jgi:hypothetical protein
VAWRFVILGTLLGGLLGLSPGAQAGSAVALAPLALDVNYNYNGDISVILPDGSPVGVTTGQPTVIPAGYYIVTLTQPGCVDTPAFILQGPGVNIQDDLQSGEEVSDGDAADFQPNATYTWRNGSTNPPVNYTFVTSGQVVGTPPGPTPVTPVETGSNKSESNSDPLGAAGAGSAGKALLRGTLAGTVTAAGRLTLLRGGKPVTRLTAGRYTLTVSDRSTTDGFMLGNTSHHELSLTGAAFVGKRSASVDLTAGRWFLDALPAGPKTYFTVVG